MSKPKASGPTSLTRRQFLLGGLGAAGAGAVALATAEHPWARRAASTASRPGRSTGPLVLLTLYGGNDGLNTVVPYQDGRYLGSRGALGHQPGEVLALSEGLGLHPALKRLKGLWDADQLAIVRGVGYREPNRSHFRSMDIWQTGVPDQAVATGWLGRWLDATGNDPLRAISVGGQLPRALAGEKASGSAVPVGPFDLPGGDRLLPGFTALQQPFDGEAAWAARVARSGADLLRVSKAVQATLDRQPEADAGGASLEGDDEGAKPAPGYGGELSAQLDVVARLIDAGTPTRVYSVSLGGFDTHANEKQAHARLMGEIDAAVPAFLERVKGHGPVVMAYSEFGRRVAANASGGTDHGTAGPVLVAGPKVKGGFYGEEPSLARLDDGDLRATTDFRSVYATVLEGVLAVEAKVALGRAFRPVPFLR